MTTVKNDGGKGAGQPASKYGVRWTCGGTHFHSSCAEGKGKRKARKTTRNGEYDGHVGAGQVRALSSLTEVDIMEHTKQKDLIIARVPKGTHEVKRKVNHRITDSKCRGSCTVENAKRIDSNIVEALRVR